VRTSAAAIARGREASRIIIAERRRSDPEFKAKQIAAASKWHAENWERVKEHKRRWKANHPEMERAAKQRRRAREAGAPGTFTAEEFAALCEAHDHRCAYCGCEAKLTADHAIPLSRGGSNFIENIVPACLSCNSAKRDRTAEEFLAHNERST